MFWRVVVLLVMGSYVVYRITLAVKIARARRAGDARRVRRLSRLAFGLVHWVIGVMALVALLFTALVTVSQR